MVPNEQAYFVQGETGPGPGVLVLHSLWGLTTSVKGLCDSLADEGFTVLAPDINFGALPETEEEGIDVLGEASPSALDEASLKDWGSYYDCRPQVVAGNIPPSMALMESRRIFSGLLSHYEEAISSLALAIRQKDSHHARHYLAA